MSKDTGGPAFPNPEINEKHGGNTYFQSHQPGMSLRDWFAGGFAAELVSVWPMTDGKLGDREAVAKAAYEYADAMIAERNSEIST